MNRPLKRQRTAAEPLSKTHPHLMAEWDFARNKANGISPDEKTYGSEVKAWWICSECNESWRSIIRNRTRTVRASGCPFCAGKKVTGWNCLKNNDLLGICKDWHPENRLTPEQVTTYSTKVVKWRCGVGHVWQTKVYTRSQGHGCPYCIGKKPTAVNNLKMNDSFGICKEWHPDNRLKPEEVTAGSDAKVKWICSKGHEWGARITDRSQGHACLQCYRDRRKNGLTIDNRIANSQTKGETEQRAKRRRKADEL